MTEQKPELQDWIAMLVLGVIWGASYILIKKGLVAFTPLQVGGIRSALSGLAFLPVAMYYFPRISRRYWRSLAIVGLVGSFLPAILFAIGQTQIPSGIAGVLNSITPLTTLVIGVLIFGQHVWRIQLVGLLIGLVGTVGLIVSGELTMNSHINWWFTIFIILASICYGISANVVSSRCRGIPALAVSAIAFSFILLPGMLLLFGTRIWDVFAARPQEAWTSLGYITVLALLSTVLASIFFFRLIQRTGAVFATMSGYIFPIFALIFGAMDGEQISYVQVIFMVVILVGVFVSSRLGQKGSLAGNEN